MRKFQSAAAACRGRHASFAAGMSTTEPAPIVVERRGDAAYLTLNRPEAMNALSRPLVAALRDAVARLRDDDSLRVLVVQAAGGKAFCAGADLRERRGMTLDDTRAYVTNLNLLFDELAAFPRPVIAAMAGMAFGGGLELALAGDIRLCTDDAELGLLEARVGIIPGAGGTQRLPRLVGVAAAKELILTGRRINASRAREIGLVAEVATRADFAAAVERWVHEVQACAPLAVREAKRAIDGGFNLALAEGQQLEAKAYAIVLASEDRNEGLAAFAEKRKPRFQGR